MIKILMDECLPKKLSSVIKDLEPGTFAEIANSYNKTNFLLIGERYFFIILN